MSKPKTKRIYGVDYSHMLETIKQAFVIHNALYKDKPMVDHPENVAMINGQIQLEQLTKKLDNPWHPMSALAHAVTVPKTILTRNLDREHDGEKFYDYNVGHLLGLTINKDGTKSAIWGDGSASYEPQEFMPIPGVYIEIPVKEVPHVRLGNSK